MFTPMRAVVYARYSSENQREASIDDQVEVCRRYIDGRSWHLAKVYADRAISGASRHSPQFQQMIADAEAGRFDVIVCEALDRIGRKLSDVADLHDRVQFRGIPLHAVKLGEITTLHVGLLGTMAQLYLSDLKEKTKRGQLGRALAGKIPGGQAYGYALVEGQSGERRIKPNEAAIVERIFREFAAGHSPRAIARCLNVEKVPGPGGREWRDTTIRGQVDRGTGILNNSLYVGRLEWNRCSYVKDPSTGRRLARPNPRAAWEIAEVPELRIIDDALWDATRERQQAIRHDIKSKEGANALSRAHRPRSLLAGLLRCSVCGGRFIATGRDHYGCATRRAKGTCSNSLLIRQHEIEARVFSGLKTRLMAPELVREFVEAFQTEANRLAGSPEQERAAAKQRLRGTDRRIAALVTVIEEGRYSSALADRLASLEAEREQLRALDLSGPEPVVRLHPRLGEVYAEKVAGLEQALNSSACIRGWARFMQRRSPGSSRR
jgi:DNA invertase Pin-like site-specific DNA recombinase